MARMRPTLERVVVAALTVAFAFAGCAGTSVRPSAPVPSPSGEATRSPIPIPTALPETIPYDDAMALFAYDGAVPFEAKDTGIQTIGGVTIRTINYATLDGARTYALLVAPPGSGPFGGVMYLHGAGGAPEDWIDEAVGMAARGVVSLLVAQPEAPESAGDPSPYVSGIVYEMRELRRALDLLASQPNVDRHRLAFVGYSFGGVRGATFAGIESSRLRAAVLMAFNPSYGSAAMASFDPIVWLPRVSPAALLMQLGRQDSWYTQTDGDAMLAAARDPKRLSWYDANHGLNQLATDDRMAWLVRYIGVAKS